MLNTIKKSEKQEIMLIVILKKLKKPYTNK